MYSYKLARLIAYNHMPKLRTYSVLCNNVDVRKNEVGYNHNNFLQNTTFIPILNQRKHLSVDGIVKWQQETYASISNSNPVHFIQDGLLSFHEITGLSWWATIITSTILIRSLMTLPLTVYQNYILAKVENISLELQDMVNELKKETAMAKKMYKLTDKQAVAIYKSSLKKQWVKLVERDNCHPFKASLIIWVQIPIWVCMSFALRNLVYMQSGDAAALVTLMEMSAGGIGWIPNLTEPDHSWILPVALGLTNLSIIEIQRLSKLRKPSKMYNVFTNVFRVFSIVMIPVAASVPSCMCLYWVTSSGVGLVQNLILISPTVRRKLGIPEAPSELEDPYNHIKEELRQSIEKFIPKRSQ
ncbi:cytochrome c oxidase assembly protein COX18, mitochondrial [Ostrinia nubilalis]|uniref:cytochrome c oxidase assembly protein COX18, mitochondrial n=1 Tax=Ostrinia nubilalis TaxID=29057 RepID=UPI00308265C9